MFNVSAGAADRDERSPLDVVMTSFMHSRNQRFELELRNIPPGVEVVVLPRPTRPRELFDFSGGEALIDEALPSAPRRELDRIAAADVAADGDGTRAPRASAWPSTTESVAG